MTTIQDDRLRALMARLEEMTPPAPEFESLGIGSPQRNRPGALTIIAIAAALVIIVTGLVWIGSRRDDSSPADQRPLTTHAVATQLPAGWEVKGAAEGSAEPPPFQLEVELFATPSVPAGPVLALLNSAVGSYADETTQSNVTLADGRRAAIGSTYFASGRSLDIEAASRTWVALMARGISDADLLAIGTMVQVEADGRSSVAGALPDGLVSVGSTSLLGGIATDDFRSDPNEWPVGSTVTGYGPVGSEAQVSIASFPATALNSAVLGVVGDVTKLSKVGAEGGEPTFAVDFGDNAGVGIYRTVDGLGFLARSVTLDANQMLSMIASLEAADDAMWNEFVAQRASAQPEPVNGAAVESTIAPPPSYQSSGAKPPRIPVDYAVTANDDGYLSTASIPAGEVSIITRFVGRSMLVDASLNGESLANLTVDVGTGSGGATLIPERHAGLYVYTASESNPAAELRVTVDGYVYSAPFITIDPTYPVQIAMVLVPPNEERTAEAKAYTYDAAGNPLDSVG